MSDHDRSCRFGVRFRRIYSVELVEGAFRGLDDGERVVWLYLKAGLQSTSVGIYRLSSAVAAEDLGNLTADEFDRRFHAVRQAYGWYFDETVRVVWIPEWLNDNPPQSPNVVASWRKLLNAVPDCAIKAEAVDAIHRHLKDLPESFRKAFGSYRVSLPEGIEISQSKPKAKPKAKPQSVQGIRDQGSEIQGKREQAPLRAGAVEKTNGTTSLPTPSTELLTIARVAVKENPNATIDEQVDALQWLARGKGELRRAQAIEYLNIARAQRHGGAHAVTAVA
jgi:hypothetical protein